MRILTSAERTALIHLAKALPKDSPEKKTILAGMSHKASGKMTPSVEKILKEAVTEAIEEIARQYETDSKVHAPVGPGYTFGSGTDGGFGGDATTYLGYMESTGKFPKSEVLSGPLHKAETMAYEEARKAWVENNVDLIAENGITEDQINYNDLIDLGLEAKAEKLSEIENEAMQDESITFRIGAFYFAPDNHSGVKGAHTIEVFALVDFEGHFLPSKSIHTFAEKFTFKKDTDLKKQLQVAIAKAMKSLD